VTVLLLSPATSLILIIPRVSFKTF